MKSWLLVLSPVCGLSLENTLAMLTAHANESRLICADHDESGPEIKSLAQSTGLFVIRRLPSEEWTIWLLVRFSGLADDLSRKPWKSIRQKREPRKRDELGTKSGAFSAEVRARLEAKWAALSPDEQARIEESLAAFQADIAIISEASWRYQKDLLRRLGVRTNIEDSEELWVQTLAAAEYVGISPERFWKMTPRELAAVLEHRATELDLLRRAGPRRAAIAPTALDLTATAERAARRQAVVNPILQRKRWKPGRLATEAGVGKNSVYQYLDGTRDKITEQNRKAIAEALGLEIDQLPD